MVMYAYEFEIKEKHKLAEIKKNNCNIFFPVYLYFL